MGNHNLIHFNTIDAFGAKGATWLNPAHIRRVQKSEINPNATMIDFGPDESDAITVPGKPDDVVHRIRKYMLGHVE